MVEFMRLFHSLWLDIEARNEFRNFTSLLLERILMDLPIRNSFKMFSPRPKNGSEKQQKCFGKKFLCILLLLPPVRFLLRPPKGKLANSWKKEKLSVVGKFKRNEEDASEENLWDFRIRKSSIEWFFFCWKSTFFSLCSHSTSRRIYVENFDAVSLFCRKVNLNIFRWFIRFAQRIEPFFFEASSEYHESLIKSMILSIE